MVGATWRANSVSLLQLSRIGITSTTDESPGPLFMVDVPAGRKCVYPEHPGGLSHISMASPKFEAASSFLQVSQQGRPIQLHSHNKDTILPPSFRQASSNRLFGGKGKHIGIVISFRLDRYFNFQEWGS